MDHPEYLLLLRGLLESPADDEPRLILADWLEEHGNRAGVRLRWWTQTARSLAEGLDRPGKPTEQEGIEEAEGEGFEEAVRSVYGRCPRLCRLGCVFFCRLGQQRLSAISENIRGWPSGWDAARYWDAVTTALHAAEWHALRLSNVTGLEAAEAAAAARAAESMPGAGWDGSAAARAARVARVAEGLAQAVGAKWLAVEAVRSMVSLGVSAGGWSARKDFISEARLLFDRLAQATLPAGW